MLFLKQHVFPAIGTVLSLAHTVPQYSSPLQLSNIKYKNLPLKGRG